MLSKLARNPLVGWESHGSRIIKASFKTKKEGITMNIIQCYAPTDDSNDDIKDQFYEQQQSITQKCSRNDLNAEDGIDDTRYEDIMGRHGLTGREKRKWRKICESVCIQQIGHRGHNISTQAYTQGYMDLPDHTTENQIDHICINKKFLRTMEDLALKNRFQALLDLLKEGETTMEDNWKSIKESLTSTCQQVLGLKEHHHKEWIYIETRDKTKERKNKKATVNNSRTQAEKVQAQAE
ncbi:unnamed protein product [Schistosoma mattheei]|uniref:Uncharacterized protein n=1 Tax=Schistosoma mattheei TaxID=31246 RepID=A0A183Q286_9TREM|nr:unnamed protein product [Schistosoma mattheei]